MTTANSSPQLSTDEYVSQFVAMVEYARNAGLKPLACVTILEHEGQYCGAVLCLYAAETKAITDKQQMIPLTPYFYGADVANALEARGILQSAHESRRTGISTVWFDISTTLI